MYSARASSPYELVPNILRYTFNKLYLLFLKYSSYIKLSAYFTVMSHVPCKKINLTKGFFLLILSSSFIIVLTPEAVLLPPKVNE